MIHYPDDFHIPNENEHSEQDVINAEIKNLIDYVVQNPHMSMLRKIVGNAEIMLIREIDYAAKQEFIRISVSECRKEIRYKLCDFNMFYGVDIPKQDKNSECDCSK